MNLIQRLLKRIGFLEDPAISGNDEWYVELDGNPVAVLSNPLDAEMFWYTWEIRPIGGDEIPNDLWSYEADTRRSFRHCFKDYCDECAFPATDNPIIDGGRVLIRGPLCRNRATKNAT